MEYLLTWISVLGIVFFFAIRKLVRDFKDNKLLAEAQMYGIYDSIWARRKKYHVTKGNYNEYILTLEEKGEQFVISKERLLKNIRYSKGELPTWPIAYQGSKPAELKIKSTTKSL